MTLPPDPVLTTPPRWRGFTSPFPSTSSTPADKQRLQVHRTVLQPRRSRALPQSTLHLSRLKPFRLIHAKRRGLKSRQSPLVRANPKRWSQRSETRWQTAGLVRRLAQSARNPLLEP